MVYHKFRTTKHKVEVFSSEHPSSNCKTWNGPGNIKSKRSETAAETQMQLKITNSIFVFYSIYVLILD